MSYFVPFWCFILFRSFIYFWIFTNIYFDLHNKKCSNFSYLKSVLCPSRLDQYSKPHLIRAAQKKVFKNSTAFKEYYRIFSKKIKFLVFHQLSESALFHYLISKLTEIISFGKNRQNFAYTFTKWPQRLLSKRHNSSIFLKSQLIL